MQIARSSCFSNFRDEYTNPKIYGCILNLATSSSYSHIGSHHINCVVCFCLGLWVLVEVRRNNNELGDLFVLGGYGVNWRRVFLYSPFSLETEPQFIALHVFISMSWFSKRMRTLKADMCTAQVFLFFSPKKSQSTSIHLLGKGKSNKCVIMRFTNLPSI
jgi:hypothetical protein